MCFNWYTTHEMRTFFTMRQIIIVCVLVLLLSIGGYTLYRAEHRVPTWVTETVTRGPIENIIAVSGTVAADNTADLAFPAGGIVSDIAVVEGDIVTEGQILVTLEQAELHAERNDALGALRIAEADRNELMAGPRSESRSVTDITVNIAEEDLVRTIADAERKIENARNTLYSDSLEALPTQKSTNDVPPTISGTFSCTEPGDYRLEIYHSNARSGYSYRLSGLESGTFTAYTEAPSPLGTCGLSIQFAADEVYSETEWVIAIPNTRSSAYVTNQNAYTLAQTQGIADINAATQALERVRREGVLENATPRIEEITRADAKVAQAAARLAQIDARIADRTLRAPFPGTINNIEVIKGETVTTLPVVTMVASDTFKITVRIPEIDITEVQIGQRADIAFDARSSESIPAEITFISPLATMIDGVAYFEATLAFPNPPEWLRGGMNADVDIIVDRKEDVLRIPKRFLIEENDTFSVLIPNNTETVTKPVTRGFVGNDGYVEIIGLSQGDTVIAP